MMTLMVMMVVVMIVMMMMMIMILGNMSHGGKRKLPEIRLILRVPSDLPTC